MNRYITKACRAAASCRKAVLAAAMAVMAIGAWADYDYSFGFSVYEVPTTLVNFDNIRTCLTVYRGDDVVVQASIADIEELYQNKTYTIPSGDYTLHNFKSYVDLTTIDEVKTVVFSIGWSGDNTLLNEYNPNDLDEWGGMVTDWRVVLEGFANFEDGTQKEVYITQNVVSYSSDKSGVYFTTSAAYPKSLILEAFSAEKIYDGLPTNATYTVDQKDATIKVAYGGSEEGPWEDEEEYDPVKFKDRVDTWARFSATKEGYCKAEAIAYVRIAPRPVMVTAPNLTFSLDAEDDAIDAEIESKIDIEKAGLNPERGVLEGDEITYKWAREDGSYDGSREKDVSYEISFPDEGGYEDYNVTYQYDENYEVGYVRGTLKFKEPEPVACPKCLCLCNCEKRTYNGTIVNNGKVFFGKITLTMKKSSKAGHADVTATVETADGKKLTFKKDGVMICGCREDKNASKCGILGLLSNLANRKNAGTEGVYDYSKELGDNVEFYDGWGECTCGCGSDEGHDDEGAASDGDSRCYWAKKGIKCLKTCCKYDFGFGKSECDFSHYDYTGCYTTKKTFVAKSIGGLLRNVLSLGKKTSTAKSGAKAFFCWNKFICKHTCLKKLTLFKKTTTSALGTRCIVRNPLVIEMEQTGLSFRQSATHSLTVSIVGDDMTGTLHSPDESSYVIKGGAKVDLTSGDPKAEVAKNVTDTTYVVSFGREDADVTAGQFTVRVDGDGTVKASGTIDGLSYSGTSDLVINSYGGIEIPVIATDKKGDIIVFKIDAPAVEEADVVELNIANVSLSKGDVLVPAEITVQE